MPDESRIIRGQRWLLHKPSTTRWKLEIESLLSGEREGILLEVGSCRQYVSRLLVDSDDPAKAKVTFESALENVVETWQPEVNKPLRNGLLLDLIIGFTPRRAFEKILAAFSKWNSLSPRPSTQDEEHATADTLSLVALEAYYPAPPPGTLDDPGFRLYTDMLWRLTGPQSGYVPHACRRLLELRLVETSDRRIKEMVSVPGVIEEFLRYALGPHRGILQNQIGYVLAHCLTSRSYRDTNHPYPLYERFIDIAFRLGATIEEKPGGYPPGLVLRNGERFDLLMPDVRADYNQATSYEGRRSALRELSAMAEGKPEWNENT
jgi:hypothetical protein